jgi:VCBS repeat protein
VRRRDLNGDGRPDLVVSRGEAGPFVSVVLNGGDGTLGAKRDTAAPAGSPRRLAVADVNGDGRPDLAVANGGQGHGISGPPEPRQRDVASRVVLVPRERVFAIAAGRSQRDLLAQTVYGSPHAPLLAQPRLKPGVAWRRPGQRQYSTEPFCPRR